MVQRSLNQNVTSGFHEFTKLESFQDYFIETNSMVGDPSILIMIQQLFDLEGTNWTTLMFVTFRIKIQGVRHVPCHII